MHIHVNSLPMYMYAGWKEAVINGTCPKCRRQLVLRIISINCIKKDTIRKGCLSKTFHKHDKYFQFENVQVSVLLKVEKGKWRCCERTHRTVAIGVEKASRTWGGIEGRSVNIKRRGEILGKHIALISSRNSPENHSLIFQFFFILQNKPVRVSNRV